MLYVLALLLVVLIALVVALLQRQGREAPAQLDPGETERIVAALHSNLARVQGEIQKAGVEQLVAHNKAELEKETGRGEEQLKARQSEIDKGLAEVRKELLTLHSGCATSIPSAARASSSWRRSRARASSKPNCCAPRPAASTRCSRARRRAASGASGWPRTCCGWPGSSRASSTASSSRSPAAPRGRTSRSSCRTSG